MKATIFQYNNWLTQTSPEYLKNTLHRILEHAGFNILGFQDHVFSPQGYTCLWLLGESHLAVHTFPEENATYIELSSCNKQKHLLFIDKLEQECTLVQQKEIQFNSPFCEETR